MFLGVQQLNPTANLDQEKFRGMLATLEGAEQRQFALDDFLLLQAKCRRPPPAIDAALLSFTPEERERFERAFVEWRDPRPLASANPQELRNFLKQQLGHEVPIEEVSSILEELHVERGHPLEAHAFLFVLAKLGAGSCVQQRRPIIWPGCSYEDAFGIGFPLDELWDLGYDDLKEITAAGYSAQELYRHELADLPQL